MNKRQKIGAAQATVFGGLALWLIYGLLAYLSGGDTRTPAGRIAEGVFLGAVVVAVISLLGLIAIGVLSVARAGATRWRRYS